MTAAAAATRPIRPGAGSGKSNTICWLAHRLAALHDASNERIMEELYWSMARRARQANPSCFAFTATPKHKMFAVFGRDGQVAAEFVDFVHPA